MTDFAAQINFRETAGFVTDGAGQTYCLATDAYTGSVIRDGLTFGWLGPAPGKDDQNAGLDPRLAGVCYGTNNGTPTEWRLNLVQTGDHEIRLALGEDIFDAAVNNHVEIFDNTTSLLSVTSTTTAHSHWFDADGQDRNATTWPTSNTPRTLTFATTTLIVKLGTATAQSGQSPLAHLAVTFVGAPPDEGGWLRYRK